ncbi:hypothetical protein FA15DRAFT_756858 [Coprinopsis marcescibilis]|uniref:Uncharacterized protein n=1 Tax=Coprinopsis marcescibilis TaxID=230819 RepID=A0A5C3KUM8_COPMA|nr:hypothetical protein FA15DRAFT_756858 [Coprinopsis marcescibilis]
MVATTTHVVAQAQDSEKRRKQTMEKAKANHLSRQLQMRLQYARLKVEHGWQRQTLNEVENLYFRHSHQRGPKPALSSLVTVTTSQPETHGQPVGSSMLSNPYSSTQSSLSFISRNTATHSVANGASISQSSETIGSQTGSSESSTPAMSCTSTIHSSTRQEPPTPRLITPTSPPKSTLSKSTASTSTNSHYTSSFGVYMTPAASSSTGPPSSSSTSSSTVTPNTHSHTTPSMYPIMTIPSSPSKSRNSSAASKSAHGKSVASSTTGTTAIATAPTAHSHSHFNFSVAAVPAMTYDAFWSNHSPSRGTSPRLATVSGNGSISSVSTSRSTPTNGQNNGPGPSSLGNQFS